MGQSLSGTAGYDEAGRGSEEHMVNLLEHLATRLDFGSTTVGNGATGSTGPPLVRLPPAFDPAWRRLTSLLLARRPQLYGSLVKHVTGGD